ncbi:MAG: hypothetical protein SFU83_11470 [Meiothermus sp.]|nr:hypothetical protein [Meiothermus sp.]
MLIIPDALTRAVSLIYPRLDDGKTLWAIAGSLAMALHGLPAMPKDIDLITNTAGAENIDQRLAEFRVFAPGLHQGDHALRYHAGKYRLEGVSVETLSQLEYLQPSGGWKRPRDFLEGRQDVRYLGMSLPVVSLQWLLEFYTQTQRPARVVLIRSKLEGK